MTEIPYVGDYKSAKEYSEAVKPFLKEWMIVVRNGFRSPYEEWMWYSKEIPEVFNEHRSGESG